jgi:hypothetical protein
MCVTQLVTRQQTLSDYEGKEDLQAEFGQK